MHEEGRNVRSHGRRVRLLQALAVGALALLASAPPATAAPACEIDGVERIVAVGDVHGAYDRLVEILRAAGLVDARLHWSGGRAHLVQLGDIVDRGGDSRKALDLLRRLEKEAARAGGAVHALLGNHEVMRMLGDVRYVSPGEYEAFVTARSEETRENLLRAAEPESRERLRQEIPLGRVEMDLAFGPQGEYGKWLRGHLAVVRINGILFLHGGISPALAATPCAVVNDTVRRELTGDMAKLRSPAPDTMVTREDGPLWYRGLAQGPPAFAPQVDEILAGQGARAIVIAHTVTPEGRIVRGFGGTVLQIDTGMQPAYVPSGRASALEIRGGTWTAIYTDRRDVLEGPPAPRASSPRPDQQPE
jgi:calcineurin-like phosphoesterase family protein